MRRRRAAGAEVVRRRRPGPLPKWCCQMRLTITRAVSGFFGSRQPVGQLQPAAAGVRREGLPAEDRQEPPPDDRPAGVRVAALVELGVVRFPFPRGVGGRDRGFVGPDVSPGRGHGASRLPKRGQIEARARGDRPGDPVAARRVQVRDPAGDGHRPVDRALPGDGHPAPRPGVKVHRPGRLFHGLPGDGPTGGVDEDRRPVGPAAPGHQPRGLLGGRLELGQRPRPVGHVEQVPRAVALGEPGEVPGPAAVLRLADLQFHPGRVPAVVPLR